MKKAADESMADVRHKIADVVRHKELIVSWTKLRSIRLRKRQSDDGDTSETFVDKMAALNKLLDERLELYKKEEKALKVMLEIEQEETLAKEARIARVRRQRQHDRLEKGRELWLFGSQVVPEELKAFHDYYTQAEESLDTFLQIRGEWDRFLVPEHVAEATRIPQGWVTPTEPSSELWQKYLKNHELTC
ncbi:programmed cell death protein 7-like [Watersipora subatra]|uniref:programmed cell death protein 7-like n=1 Tax=Watersipora subatra TaxID=2589382 RepID=UPI00355B709E